MKNYLLLLLLATATIQGCKKEKPEPPEPPIGPAPSSNSSVYVVNEGPFSTGSGTVTHYNIDTKSATQRLFQNKNNRPIGNLFQSMTIHNGYGYLVVNNAAKVEVVSMPDFKSVGTISGLISPRYFIGASPSIGYVSDWGLGGVAVVDLNKREVVKVIETGKGPERMLIQSGKLYVTNTGDWSNSDNKFIAIDLQTNQVIHQFVAGDRPNSIVADKNGIIWVLFGGESDWQNPQNDTPGSLLKFDPVSHAITVFNFSTSSQHPNKLTINATGTTLYFLSDLYSGSLYSMDINASSLPTTPFANRIFYGVAADPRQEGIYAADAVDFNQDGWVLRYDESANVVDSFKVGIIPGNFAFY